MRRALYFHGARRRLAPGRARRQLRLEERRALPQEKRVEVELLVPHVDRNVRVIPCPQKFFKRCLKSLHWREHHLSQEGYGLPLRMLPVNRKYFTGVLVCHFHLPGFLARS